MAIERYGSKTDVVVKLVLVFFVCLLSFSIGTFVGKKFSDNQHKLAKFEPESGGAHDVAAAAGDDHKPKAAMTDEEFAKLAEEFVADDESGRAPAAEHGKKDDHGAKADAHGAPAVKDAVKKDEHAAPAKKDAKADAHAAPAKKDEHAASAKKETPKKDGHGAAPVTKDDRHASHAEPAKIAEKIAKNQKVEAHVESGSRIPAALPKEIGSSAIGKYTVQVGSYPTEDEAKKRTDALKEQTFSAFYVEAKVKDKVWYRVSVGLFNTQKEAEAYMKDLLERKKVPSAIVQKIAK